MEFAVVKLKCDVNIKDVFKCISKKHLKTDRCKQNIFPKYFLVSVNYLYKKQLILLITTTTTTTTGISLSCCLSSSCQKSKHLDVTQTTCLVSK